MIKQKIKPSLFVDDDDMIIFVKYFHSKKSFIESYNKRLSVVTIIEKQLI